MSAIGDARGCSAPEDLQIRWDLNCFAGIGPDLRKGVPAENCIDLSHVDQRHDSATGVSMVSYVSPDSVCHASFARDIVPERLQASLHGNPYADLFCAQILEGRNALRISIRYDYHRSPEPEADPRFSSNGPSDLCIVEYVFRTGRDV